ncbi:hypothetical protein SNE40_021817 [Patella caerulea]|uniref:Uncharacterized protein n=1 Tax=Patella caerulea TaxID=87958 RepID=A0AAN8G4X4_PATCE
MQRRNNELMYITLPISSSMESHIYESVPDLTGTPGIQQPCTPPGIREISDSSLVADLPKVTSLSTRYKSNPVSTSTQRHDTENENESSPFLQNNCQDNHHQSNINITTSVTHKFPPEFSESDVTGNDADCSQIYVCRRNNESVSSLYIASNPDHSKHKTSSPSGDGYIIPSSVHNKEGPLYMASKAEVTLDLPKHLSPNTTCSPIVLGKERLRFDMARLFQANAIWGSCTEIYGTTEIYETALNRSKQTQSVRMSALETAI